MPRIIDAIGTATPVTLDSAWRKIEYRLDVRRGLQTGLAALKLLIPLAEAKSRD